MRAWRRLRRAPGPAAAIVLMLALGIGSSTAMFSLAGAAWLRPLPYPHSRRLVSLWLRNPKFPRLYLGLDAAGTAAVRAAPGLGAAAAYAAGGAVWRMAGQRRQLGTALVSAGLFRLLEVRPMRGALPAASGHAALISPRLAAALGGPARALGRTLRSAGRAVTVVGIAPPGFRFPARIAPGFPLRTDIWLPLTAANAGVLAHSALAQGGTLALRRHSASQAELAAQLASLTRRLPASDQPGPGWRLVPISLAAESVGAVRGPLALLLLATVLVLLIAIINAAHLLLERAWARTGEIALRLALGASSSNIRRLALADSLCLALAGGGLGLGLSFAIVATARHWSPTGWLPAAGEPGLAVAAFALAAAVAAGVATGWLPARAQMRRDPQLSLKAGANGTVRGGRPRARGFLLLGEAAVATALVASSLLLIRGFARLAATPTGMNTRHVLSLYFSAPLRASATPAARQAFWRQLLRQVRGLPGVRGAAITGAPMLGGMTFIEPPLETGSARIGHYRHRGVTAGYFGLLHIPVLRGRDFGPRDAPGSAPVVIVNQALARVGWPGADPVGHEVRVAAGGKMLAFAVVGVAGDTRDNGILSPPAPEIYTPLLQTLPANMSTDLLVRASGPPTVMESRLRNAVWSAAGEIPIAFFHPLDTAIGRVQAAPRFVAAVIAGFAALALVLAAIGIYAVFTYAVTRRRREIGIRMALGAAPGAIAGAVLTAAARLVVAGAGLGLLAAWLVARSLRAWLYGIGPADPWALAGAAALLALAALAACALPLRRACRVDPAQTLREE